MLSRVADSLYWMSRNFERAEQNARILDVHLTQMVETSSDESFKETQWKLLYEACSTLEELEALENKKNSKEEDLIFYLALSHENPNSVFNCVRIARENARVCRDHIPNELFEVWNDVFLYTKDAQNIPYSLQNMRLFLSQIKRLLSLFKELLSQTCLAV